MSRELFDNNPETAQFFVSDENREHTEHEIEPKVFLDRVGELQLTAEAQTDLLLNQERNDQTTRPESVRKIKDLQAALTRKLRRYLPLVLLASMEIPHARLPEGQFSDRARAGRELQTSGITNEQRQAYKPGISELLYRAITPKGYQSLGRVIQQGPKNLPGRLERTIPAENESDIEYRADQNPDREDAWRLYLGLPQTHGTFGTSEYQPKQSTEDKYYYKINDWTTRFARSIKPKEWSSVSDTEFAKSQLVPAFLRILDEQSGSEESHALETYSSVDGIPWKPIIENDRLMPGKAILVDAPAGNEKYGGQGIGVMAAFKLSKGQDDRGSYISYYDRWDLAEAPTEGQHGLLGKPFEIYDRIYYDPETKVIIAPANTHE